MMNFLSLLFGGGKFEKIDVDGYVEQYYKQNNHVLIDVRTPQEFKGGHLPKAKNIPLNEISAKMSKIPRDKPVVIVCKTGSRSAAACNMLQRAGYENIINLKGGTLRWNAAGHPLK